MYTFTYAVPWYKYSHGNEFVVQSIIHKKCRSPSLVCFILYFLPITYYPTLILLEEAMSIKVYGKCKIAYIKNISCFFFTSRIEGYISTFSKNRFNTGSILFYSYILIHYDYLSIVVLYATIFKHHINAFFKCYHVALLHSHYS